MTSRIELRKEQQRVITTSTPSLGFLAGEGVVTPKPKWDKVWLDGLEGRVGFFQISKGSLVRAIKVASGNNASLNVVDVSSNSDSANGVTISTADSSVRQWQRHNILGMTELEPKPEPNIDQIYVTVESGDRPQRPVVYEVIDETSYKAIFDAGDPVWDGPIHWRQPFRIYLRPLPEDTVWNAKILGVANGRSAFDEVNNALRALSTTTQFGDFVNTYGLDLRSSSTVEREVGEDLLKLKIREFGFVDPYKFARREYDNDGNWIIPLVFYLRTVTNGLYYIQESGWEPSDEETRTGTPPSGTTEAVPQSVSISFKQADGTEIESKSALIVPEITTQQTHFFKRTESLTTVTPKVSFDVGRHAAWLKEAIVPQQNRIENALLDTYQIETKWEGEVPICIFAHSGPINVPSIATLAGTRPNEYLTYSNTTWNESFQKLRCRCPVWILYDVLTAERFGIEIASSRIDLNSFLVASKYCQTLIDSKPRWAFDGALKGTQNNIINSLLALMQGWLINKDGKFSIKIEKPDVADWLICPAVVINGNIKYRDALPKIPVRCNYTNRLTGQIETTTGVSESRLVDVDWQDPDVVERWAKWESFKEQNLLDSVEFSLPWSYHKIAVGDLINLYDPIRADIRIAGRVIENTSNYLQLDIPPLELWPSLVSGAQLLQTNRNAAIDPDTWGWSVFTFPTAKRPTIRIQKDAGGFNSYTVTKIEFLATGRPEYNRVYLLEDLGSVDISRKVWAIESAEIYPSQWRVQSVSESGRSFGIVCTPYINGMHIHVEDGTTIPKETKEFTPTCGTNLSQFSGFFDDITARYPDDSAGPFDPENTMDNLTTSCL